MNVQEFRNSIDLDSIIEIKNKEYEVEEIVEFKTEENHSFQAVFLNQEMIIVSNLEEELFIIANQVDLDIEEPFPKNIEFDSEIFEFSEIIYAGVENVIVGELFNEDDDNSIWYYQSEYDKRLLIFNDPDTEERIDLCGEIVFENEISIL